MFAESYRTMLLKSATVIYVRSYGEVACYAKTQCMRKAIGSRKNFRLFACKYTIQMKMDNPKIELNKRSHNDCYPPSESNPYSLSLSHVALHRSMEHSSSPQCAALNEYLCVEVFLPHVAHPEEANPPRKGVHTIDRTNYGMQSRLSGMSEWTKTVYPSHWKVEFGSAPKHARASWKACLLHQLLFSG